MVSRAQRLSASRRRLLRDRGYFTYLQGAQGKLRTLRPWTKGLMMPGLRSFGTSGQANYWLLSAPEKEAKPSVQFQERGVVVWLTTVLPIPRPDARQAVFVQADDFRPGFGNGPLNLLSFDLHFQSIAENKRAVRGRDPEYGLVREYC